VHVFMFCTAEIVADEFVDSGLFGHEMHGGDLARWQRKSLLLCLNNARAKE